MPSRPVPYLKGQRVGLPVQQRLVAAVGPGLAWSVSAVVEHGETITRFPVGLAWSRCEDGVQTEPPSASGVEELLDECIGRRAALLDRSTTHCGRIRRTVVPPPGRCLSDG